MHAVYGRDTDACTRCVAGGWTCPCYLRDSLRCIGGGLVIDRGGDSAGVFLSNQAFPTASRALCELHLPAWNRKIHHRNIPPPWTPCGFRMPPCHTIHRAVSGVWRGRMPGGLKPVSHRVSVWVLSCVIDFPVSDAPRNTAGAALQNTSGAALVFDAVRATHESSARNTAGAANSAGAALVLNAVRATHEPSARKRGASAMNGRRGSARGMQTGSFASARSVGACA